MKKITIFLLITTVIFGVLALKQKSDLASKENNIQPTKTITTTAITTGIQPQSTIVVNPTDSNLETNQIAPTNISQTPANNTQTNKPTDTNKTQVVKRNNSTTVKIAVTPTSTITKRPTAIVTKVITPVPTIVRTPVPTPVITPTPYPIGDDEQCH